MKRIVAVLISTLILASALDVKLGTHYCCGEIVKTSILLGSFDNSCCTSHAHAEEGCLSKNSSKSYSSKGCCDNEYISLSIANEYLKNGELSPTLEVKFFSAFEIIRTNNYSFDKGRSASFVAHSPPGIYHDIPVLYQVFLI